MFKLCCLSYHNLFHNGIRMTFRQLLAFIIGINSMVRSITVTATKASDGCHDPKNKKRLNRTIVFKLVPFSVLIAVEWV